MIIPYVFGLKKYIFVLECTGEKIQISANWLGTHIQNQTNVAEAICVDSEIKSQWRSFRHHRVSKLITNYKKKKNYCILRKWCLSHHHHHIHRSFGGYDDDGPLLAIGLCYSLLSRSRDVPTDTPSSTYVIFIANNFFILTSKLTFIIFIDKDYLIWNSFVRCLDTTTSSTLDTSPRARFHQTCLYWQHPHLPWLDLFPRSSGRVSATSFMATNEEVKEALLTEWKESFRSLFQVSCNRVIYLAFQSTSLFPLSFVLV